MEAIVQLSLWLVVVLVTDSNRNENTRAMILNTPVVMGTNSSTASSSSNKICSTILCSDGSCDLWQ